jgi:uncharacterized protein YkwD
VLLAVIVAVAVGLLGFPSTAAAWGSNQFSSTSEKQLFRLHNQARAAAGRKALKWDPALLTIARARSKDMIVNNYFSHEIPPDGHLVFRNMARAGYCSRTAGENIGWNNYPDDVATVAMHESFMGSSGHRSNILSSRFDVMAAGAYKGPTGKKMWTVIFADKCGSSGSTPAPKPKPTQPKPKPKPVAAKPKPAPKPQPKPKPAVVAAPSPSPSPPPPVALPREVPDDPGGEPRLAHASPEPPPEQPPPPPGGLRVHEPTGRAGILDSLLGTIIGMLFGG